ncbi:hypothetical protein I302_104594 [Kwoniella bestiolae CBS 10118]|uniref:Uncharacterized protein n=1 Tax=Kwoniella bestiolae CBS 10118 TaxID=1296100 RepID=A0A1B9GBN8_9TREE|nr:hypothetical protein I302_03300 [Kwoniella bestiolae CBS 10118]OCF28441.1 hypothetical protein I302_03300 [Kwoniella bestiolae CBS 10118]
MGSREKDEVVVTIRPYREIGRPHPDPTLTYSSQFTLKNDPTAEKWRDVFTDQTMAELAEEPLFVPTDGTDHDTIKESVRRHAGIMFHVRGRSMADGLLHEEDKEDFYRDFCEQLLEAHALSSREKTVEMAYERDDGRHCVETKFHLPPFQPSRLTEVVSTLALTGKYAQSDELEFKKSEPLIDDRIPPVYVNGKLLTGLASEFALDMGKDWEDTLRSPTSTHSQLMTRKRSH